MKRLTNIFLPILLLASLTGCKSSSGLTWKSGDKVYYDRILFDTSDETAKNPHIYLGVDGKVASVKLGRDDLKFGYSGKVLTLEAAALRKAGAGEKSATVTFKDGKKNTVEIFNATKFIKTAEDFQGIGADEKSAQGYYVLANDIDCSSIANFEPIGQYFSEEDPTNFYFHGILDGDGYAIKNVKCSYSDSPVKGTGSLAYPTNFDVYSGAPKFSNESHQQGDNVGIFQVIGSSGVVRNVAFDNCQVHGRTIVGIVAGNLMGKVENILINSNCSVKMDTHFYDDDCNTGAAFGIVAGSGNANHIISLTSQVSLLDFYQDYGDDYAGKIGTDGWDHSTDPANTDPWWRFAGVSKNIPDTSTKITDSNGKQSNGVYSVIGKCWGQTSNSVGASFKVIPCEESGFDVAFGHTHQAINKPTSGDSDLGSIENCEVFSLADLKKASTYTQFSFDAENVWNIQDGALPKLKENINRFDIAK
jgi:hypothetical protein